MASTALLKTLTTPNKIASALDWKKLSGSTILSLDIHKDRIGLAIASHPAFQEAVTVLEPLKLTKDDTPKQLQRMENQPRPEKSRFASLDTQQLSNLSKIVSDYKVCGVVVSWPLQQDTGKMGAACGHVLNMLEELVSAQQLQQQQRQLQEQATESAESQTASGKVTSGAFPVLRNRPICLWDSNHTQEKLEYENRIDSWGRSVAYSHRPMASTTAPDVLPPTVREQYSKDANNVPAQIWDDFCRVYWPEIYEHQPAALQRQLSLVEDYDSMSSLEDDRGSLSSRTERRMEAMG